MLIEHPSIQILLLKFLPLANLIDYFQRLPGIGPKSAQRIAFYLLKMPLHDVEKFAKAMITAKETIHYCDICFNMSATKGAIQVSNFTNNVSNKAKKYTYAINGQIKHESEKAEDYYILGDCKNVGQIYQAMNDGYYAAMSI